MTYTRRLLQTHREVVDLCNSLHRYPELGLDTESSGPLLYGLTGKKSMVNMYRASLTGISLATPDQRSYYAPVGHRKDNIPIPSFEVLTRAIREYRGTVVIHNVKHELKAITQGPLAASLPPLEPGRVACTQVGSWLGQRASSDDGSPFGLKALSKTYRGVEMSTFDDTTKGLDFDQLAPKDGLDYACEDAEAALDLWPDVRQRLVDWGLLDLFWSLEMPMCEVLRHMEDSGMLLDADDLMQAVNENTARLAEVEEDWAFLVGAMNMNSGKQLQWFFDEGHWPKLKRTGKRGDGKMWATDAETIAAILEQCEPGSLGHRAAELKAEQAEVQKLVSTYGEEMLMRAWQHPDLRLHCDFLQTGTATGRFAASKPNLTNIPKRKPAGKRIRQAFVALLGWRYVSADYSQIELRVLAHIVGRGQLYDDFFSGADPHKQLAEELTSLLGRPITRDQGKTTNFSTVYSVGPKKLAGKLGMTFEEAKHFLKTFRGLRPEVFDTLDDLADACERDGYARTILRRRRPLALREAREEVGRLEAAGYNWRNSEEFRQAFLHEGSVERKAKNTPIQGSAADLMKLAMLAFYRSMDKSRCRIVCQIHDDLVTEMEESYVEEGSALLKQTLEGVYKLRVPLVADPAIGQRWSEL